MTIDTSVGDFIGATSMVSDDLIHRLQEGKPPPYVDPLARDLWNRDGFEAAAVIKRLCARVVSEKEATAYWVEQFNILKAALTSPEPTDAQVDAAIRKLHELWQVEADRADHDLDKFIAENPEDHVMCVRKTREMLRAAFAAGPRP